MIYQNSYTGVMKKGMSALQEDNYEVAQKYFDRAVIKDKSRPEAYKGLADIYVDQGDLDSAESVYLTALETQPSNEKLYEAVIDFYVKMMNWIKSLYCWKTAMTVKYLRQ